VVMRRKEEEERRTGEERRKLVDGEGESTVEREEQVCRTRRRGGRLRAVLASARISRTRHKEIENVTHLCDPHTRTSDHYRCRGRDIERVPAVSARSHNIDVALVPVTFLVRVGVVPVTFWKCFPLIVLL